MNPPNDPPGRKRRILAVDDTPANLRLLIEMLKQHDYRVHPAASGQAALRFLENTLPDLILLDAMMPGMDGYALCERLKADERTRDIPVIFISAANQPLNKVMAFACGGVDYIVKPFQAEEVIARIETHLALGQWQQELAQRVAERTAELEEANARLAAEIEQRRQAETTLREAQAKLRLAADIVRLAYWEWDVRNGEVHCSPEWTRQMGYAKVDSPTTFDAWKGLLHPEDRPSAVELLEQLAVSGEFELEIDYRQRNQAGKYRWIRSRMRVLIDESGDRYRLVGTHLDITEQKTAEQETLQVAQQDALTGLANRKLLYESAARILANARRQERKIGVLFMDLDRFKPINDTHGHDVGDRLLKAVAQRIERAVRAGDLVGRFGGDEFVAVLVNIEDIEDVAHLAGHIVRSLGRGFVIDGLDLQVSASMGISLFPYDGETIEALIQNADFAMYEAKKVGRACYRFFKYGVTKSCNLSTEENAATPNRLRAALEAGGFSLVYQPVFDMETGVVVEAEALLRWRQPDGSYVSPETFLPVAESTGLIKSLGEWLLRTACEQQQAWKLAGLPDITVAVKISPVQFRQKGFVQKVLTVIDATGIEPARVSLELSERTLMGNGDETIRVIAELKDIGVRVAIDNFGVGYSNMRQLSRLLVDKLKVDKSFLQHPNTNGGNFAAVDAILALGQSLHMDIVLEGVETDEDLAFVRGHGCHYAQGFHLGRPMSGPEFPTWWQRREQRNKPSARVPST